MNGLTPRMLTLAIAFPIVIVIFIILGILVLRKDSKYWGNRFFALFFWLTAATLFFNVFYLFSTNDAFITVFNLVTVEAANISFFALLLGILVISKGEDEIIHRKKFYALIMLMIVLIVIQVCIPNAVYFESTDPHDPRWSLPMGLYEFAFSTALMVAVYYFSFTFYQELSEMRSKFRRYLIGIAFLYITLISVTIDNLNIFGESYALIGAALNFCVLIGALLIYFGIIRK
ncbi:MAG: hypothetical protein HWN66_01085 [Candidatus Helarchaeota archaeon]|nr:hypothetical protein [Candidatus Helarchaeota archaeon]